MCVQNSPSLIVDGEFGVEMNGNRVDTLGVPLAG